MKMLELWIYKGIITDPIKEVGNVSKAAFAPEKQLSYFCIVVACWQKYFTYFYFQH